MPPVWQGERGEQGERESQKEQVGVAEGTGRAGGARGAGGAGRIQISYYVIVAIFGVYTLFLLCMLSNTDNPVDN